MVKVALISGSLRSESVSTKIAKNVGELFPAGYEAEFVEIGNLPLYNEDIDTEVVNSMKKQHLSSNHS